MIAAFTFTNGPALAEGISIKSVRAMALADTSKPGAVALTIEADSADRLVGISTPIAGVAQVHNSKMKGKKMRMRRTESFDIPAGTTEMKHGGTHIMLMQLSGPLVAGDHFPMTLTFENGGTVEVTVTVMGG